VVIGLAAMLQVGSSAWAQEPTRTPSPKELWDAYPLEPGRAPATATPSAEFGASVTATPTPRPASSDDGGTPWLLIIVLAAPLVFAAGLLLGHRRDRARAAAAEGPVQPPEPQEPKPFQWRDYPEPARPAPPPPPVPGQDEAPEPERVRTGRFKQKQKEPH
jgi:hypothetical protein